MTSETVVEIRRDAFFINGRPTYEGQAYEDKVLEGLLFNTRMVQALFDDRNPETRPNWAYPDTGEWDPDRNTREFVTLMPTYRAYGVLGLSLNMQCGNPVRNVLNDGGGVVPLEQPWEVSGYEADGALRQDWLARLSRILEEADRLGMVIILGLFYFGQDQRLENEAAVRQGAENIIGWLKDGGHRNVIIEVANECDVPRYTHPILTAEGMPGFLGDLRSYAGEEMMLSVSYRGGSVPSEKALAAMDFVLMHGNGIGSEEIGANVREAREMTKRNPMPIVFNEDNHFDFARRPNNMLAAVENYASWGYFDPGARGDYNDGFQCPPVQWGLTTPRKRQFFEAVGAMTGARRSGIA